MKLCLVLVVMVLGACAAVPPSRVQVVALSADRGERCWYEGQTLIEDMDTHERRWVCGLYGKPGERFRLQLGE
jgi:hypothetical protein